MENLLDIDFDGSAPASSQKEAATTPSSGLEDLTGTSGPVNSPPAVTQQSGNNLDDLMGVFGNGSSTSDQAGAPGLSQGLADLSMDGGQGESPAGNRKSKDNIKDLF